MFLSREINIKLCQNYTKSCIYQISYKIRSIKQTIFKKYATNLSVGYYVTKTSANRSERYRTAIEYGLFNTTNFIRSLIYIRFGIILTQFYINFSRQEHQIDVFLICIVQNLRFSGFSLYLLSFFLYSPFKHETML